MSPSMSVQLEGMLARLLATDAPALPLPGAMQVWLHLAWGLVLAWLGVATVARWWPGPARHALRLRAVAVLLALWACLPGAWSPVYWLGLAFQAPSGMAVFLCARLLWCRVRMAACAQPVAVGGGTADRWLVVLAVCGVLLGWALLLDAFALLPVQWYAWGFSPLAVALVGLLALLPWVVDGSGSVDRRHLLDRWMASAALGVFVVWRLPGGNVWDAVLDPWLWLALHVYVFKNLVRPTTRAGKATVADTTGSAA